MRRFLSFALILIGTVSLSAVAFERHAQSQFQRQQREALQRAVAAAPAPVAARLPASGLIGQLDIPRIDLSVVVIEGDDTPTLAKAVGHLPDTPLPWEEGNSAMAGHRDTYFRPLRNVRLGDEIRLTSPRGVFTYKVRKAFVTVPEDLSVLQPSSGSEITLVTCYPFNYVGSAPKRFIVQATRVDD